MSNEKFDPYDFSKKVIDGVPVYYKNLPWAPCIHIRIVFNVGAFDDPVGKEGLSHFLEHMWGDGCPSLADKKSIKHWAKEHTLNSKNAFTNFNNTWYMLKCLPAEYENCLAGLKDMIFNSYILPEDVEHERKVIMQEAWSRFLNSKFLAYTKEYNEIIYQGHTHERQYVALGWPQTIAEITQKDIKSHRDKYYGIGNLFIVLTGAVTDSHVEQLKSFTDGLPRVLPNQSDYGKISKPKVNKIIKRADEIGEVKEQVEISFARNGEELSFSKTTLARGLRTFLYDLLHERLRIDHSLCYSIQVSSWFPKSFTTIWMNVKTDESNIDLVEKEFWSVLKEIQEGKHRERFEQIKRVTIEQIEATELLSANIADDVVPEIYKYDGHIVSNEETLNEIKKINFEDIIDFSKWAFDPEFTITEIILPSKKSN